MGKEYLASVLSFMYFTMLGKDSPFCNKTVGVIRILLGIAMLYFGVTKI